MARPRLVRPSCGFADIRLDAAGVYFCCKCGRDLGAAFRDVAKAILPTKMVSQLDRQCTQVEAR